MKKVFLFLGCAALIVAGSMFLQSCESDFSFSTENAHEVFLDLDISIMSQRDLTEAEQGILLKGHERFAARGIFENNQFALTVSNGAELRMSERLFNFYKENMMEMNREIKEQGIILIEVAPGKFQPIDEIVISGVPPRLRCTLEQPNDPNAPFNVSSGWNIGVRWTTWSLNHEASIEFMHGMRSGLGEAAIIAGLVGAFGSRIVGYATTAVGVGLTLNDMRWSNTMMDYLRYSNNTGIRVTQTTFQTPGWGVSGQTITVTFDR